MQGDSVELAPGIVITVLGQPTTITERLLDEGQHYEHALRCGCQDCRYLLEHTTHRRRALALAVSRARPVTLFKAMVEGWSKAKLELVLGREA